MEKPFTRVGKQIMASGSHYADAADETAAQFMLEALNTKAMQARAIQTATSEEETYQIGVRDGYEGAVQDIDLQTGGDGEYYASTIPGRGCPDADTMIAGIVGRYDAAIARATGASV